MEQTRPKRRKYADNPYKLEFDEKLDVYKLYFVDGKGNGNYIEISYEIYNAFDKFELEDVSEMNEYDRHIEHLEQSDESLYSKNIYKIDSLDAKVSQMVLYEDLRSAINRLPEIQNRRLKMYFFNDMTLEQIATLENCTFRAVKFSIDIAIKNLKNDIKIKKY